MSNQIQITVTKVNGSTQVNPLVLTFPINEIMLVSTTSGCFFNYKGSKYETNSSVGDLVTTGLVQATVLRVNDSILPTALTMAFPASVISISESTLSGASASITFNGTVYHVSETLTDLEGEANEGGATEVVVYQRKTILTDAQIKALPNSFIELVPAPTASQLLILHSAAMKYLLSVGGGYSNVDVDNYIITTYGDWENTASVKAITVNDFVAGNTGRLHILPSLIKIYSGELISEPLSLDQSIGLPLKLAMNNSSGDLTGGDPANTLEVTVFYSIVDL
jgi:hypothetical protein